MAAPKTKVYVGNIPDGCTEEDLRNLFKKYGEVTECDVIKKYGFMHMATPEQAEEAIKNLNNYTLMGSSIRVELPRSKLHPEPGASGRASNQCEKTKVYVGNIPDGCTGEDLRNLFAKYGEGTEFKKFGFVHMATPEQAEAAIKNLNNYTLMGSSISVEPSKSNLHPKPAASGRASNQCEPSKCNLHPEPGASGRASNQCEPPKCNLHPEPTASGRASNQCEPSKCNLHPEPGASVRASNQTVMNCRGGGPPRNGYGPPSRGGFGGSFPNGYRHFDRPPMGGGDSFYDHPFGFGRDRSHSPNMPPMTDDYVRCPLPPMGGGDLYSRPIPSMTMRDAFYEVSVAERSDYLYSRRPPPTSSMRSPYWYDSVTNGYPFYVCPFGRDRSHSPNVPPMTDDYVRCPLPPMGGGDLYSRPIPPMTMRDAFYEVSVAERSNDLYSRRPPPTSSMRSPYWYDSVTNGTSRAPPPSATRCDPPENSNVPAKERNSKQNLHIQRENKSYEKLKTSRNLSKENEIINAEINKTSTCNFHSEKKNIKAKNKEKQKASETIEDNQNANEEDETETEQDDEEDETETEEDDEEDETETEEDDEDETETEEDDEEDETETTFIHKKIKQQASESHQDISLKENNNQQVSSPMKNENIKLSTDVNVPLRQSVRKKFPPLEIWRNERLLYTSINGIPNLQGYDPGGNDALVTSPKKASESIEDNENSDNFLGEDETETTFIHKKRKEQASESHQDISLSENNNQQVSSPMPVNKIDEKLKTSRNLSKENEIINAEINKTSTSNFHSEKKNIKAKNNEKQKASESIEDNENSDNFLGEDETETTFIHKKRKEQASESHQDISLKENNNQQVSSPIPVDSIYSICEKLKTSRNLSKENEINAEINKTSTCNFHSEKKNIKAENKEKQKASETIEDNQNANEEDEDETEEDETDETETEEDDEEDGTETEEDEEDETETEEDDEEDKTETETTFIHKKIKQQASESHQDISLKENNDEQVSSPMKKENIKHSADVNVPLRRSVRKKFPPFEICRNERLLYTSINVIPNLQGYDPGGNDALVTSPKKASESIEDNENSDNFLGEVETETTFIHKKRKEQASESHQDIPLKENNNQQVSSPMKNENIKHSTDVNVPLRRSVRKKFPPLEICRNERLLYTSINGIPNLQGYDPGGNDALVTSPKKASESIEDNENSDYFLGEDETETTFIHKKRKEQASESHQDISLSENNNQQVSSPMPVNKIDEKLKTSRNLSKENEIINAEINKTSTSNFHSEKKNIKAKNNEKLKASESIEDNENSDNFLGEDETETTFIHKKRKEQASESHQDISLKENNNQQVSSPIPVDSIYSICEKLKTSRNLSKENEINAEINKTSTCNFHSEKKNIKAENKEKQKAAETIEDNQNANEEDETDETETEEDDEEDDEEDGTEAEEDETETEEDDEEDKTETETTFIHKKIKQQASESHQDISLKENNDQQVSSPMKKENIKHSADVNVPLCRSVRKKFPPFEICRNERLLYTSINGIPNLQGYDPGGNDALVTSPKKASESIEDNENSDNFLGEVETETTFIHKKRKEQASESHQDIPLKENKNQQVSSPMPVNKIDEKLKTSRNLSKENEIINAEINKTSTSNFHSEKKNSKAKNKGKRKASESIEDNENSDNFLGEDETETTFIHKKRKEQTSESHQDISLKENNNQQVSSPIPVDCIYSICEKLKTSRNLSKDNEINAEINKTSTSNFHSEKNIKAKNKGKRKASESIKDNKNSDNFLGEDEIETTFIHKKRKQQASESHQDIPLKENNNQQVSSPMPVNKIDEKLKTSRNLSKENEIINAEINKTSTSNFHSEKKNIKAKNKEKQKASESIEDNENSDNFLGEDETETTFIHKKRKQQASESHQDISPKENNDQQVSSPMKKENIKHSTDVNVPVRRSVRKKFPPLEAWRGERLLYTSINGIPNLQGYDPGGKDALISSPKKVIRKEKINDNDKVKERPVLDAINGQSIHDYLMKHFDAVAWEKESKEHRYRIKRIFETPSFVIGFIQIEANKSKPMQYMPNDDTYLTVVRGEVEATIGENVDNGGEKSIFFVPRCVPYSVKNVGVVKALLTFVVGELKGSLS